MNKSLTSNPELFSDLSWNLLVLGENNAQKWGHNEFNIEHILQTLFTSRDFKNHIDNLSIDQNTVLDITENFLEENSSNESDILIIGEDLEILLDSANQIRIHWGSNLIEIPHILIALAGDERLGNFVFEESNLTIEKLEEELKYNPNIIEKRNPKEKLQNNKINKKEYNLVLSNTGNSEELRKPKSEINVKDKTNIELIKENTKEDSLLTYGKDLTQSAKEGLLDPVIGRENEINNLMRVLSRRTKNNPILIGNPGVGKTAIIQLLAQLIEKKEVPDSLKDLKIISLDFGALVSGTKFRGQLEERLRSMLDQLKDQDEGVILFIDEIHTILNSDRATTEISSLLKPLLTEGGLRCIGTTTPDKFRENIEKDQALNRCFQKIYVNEPNLEMSSKILNGIKRKYEVHHGIRITNEAIDYSAKLANRYISDKSLPDKAIDLIDEAAAQLKIESTIKPNIISKEEAELEKIDSEIANFNSENFDQKELLLNKRSQILYELDILNEKWAEELALIARFSSLLEREDKLSKFLERCSITATERGQIEELKRELLETRNDMREIENELENFHQQEKFSIKYKVGPDDIADVVSKITGIPVSKVVSNERKKLINLEKEISQKVIGQQKAISAISSAIRRARAGMKNPKRPIGSFLFMGPTGVGKTELAKSLAASLFDEEEALLRLDMSEYMERNAVARLLGAPPGYVGYEEGGQLTEAVKRKPYSVILLDEIEKAHPEVFNILLQVLDEGRLTDSQGSTIDFKNTVIIMTSNIAGKAILENSRKIKTNRDEEVNTAKSLEDSINNSLSSTFRPEFLNRIDEVITFEPLSKDQLKKIIVLQIEDLKKLLSEQKIEINVDSKVISKIANDSYEPEFGARPVNREIRRQIENPLASRLLDSKFQNKKIITVKFDPKNKDILMFTPS
tara:strand:- start:3692 stop:6439 length:2748 start_codon:yes stop_codon:yes gene_type:complete